MKIADLQLHSSYSDGTFTPAELVERAKDAGLDCIALTDHDTVDGVWQTARLALQAGIEFIPGVELTAYAGDDLESVDACELHILGYFVKCSDKEFVQKLKTFKDERDARANKILAKLKAAGINLKREQLDAVAEGRSTLGRLHVARALMAAGYVRNTGEAFHRYIGKGGIAWAPKFRIGVREACEIIHKAGGAAILAHPGTADIDDLIPDLLKQGIDGIEVWHPKHTFAQRRRYKALAERLGCLITGGSDCHGFAKGEVLIGSVRLPYEYVERLKQFVSRAHPPSHRRPA